MPRRRDVRLSGQSNVCVCAAHTISESKRKMLISLFYIFFRKSDNEIQKKRKKNNTIHRERQLRALKFQEALDDGRIYRWRRCAAGKKQVCDYDTLSELLELVGIQD